MKRWTIVALANKPYLPYVKRLAESLAKVKTKAYTCFSLVNCTADLPVDEIIYERTGNDKAGLYHNSEAYYCIWGKPRTLRRIIKRGHSDYVIWIDADSFVLRNFDSFLEKMERFEMCSKQKVSNGKMLTGMIGMHCSKKMKKFCDEWEWQTHLYALRAKKPWSSSQRTMNTIMWPKWKRKVRFLRVPGNVFDLKWRKKSHIWTACGVDDRKVFAEACQRLK